MTVLVGEGGKGPGSVYSNTSSYGTAPAGFPDGGNATYNAHGGGGSSRIAGALVPYPTRNDSSTTYLLIGAGGGGGIGYTSDSGTNDGRGGYPAGYGGGGYYSSGESLAVTGKGATQSSGGNGGSAGRQPAGSPGSKYSGGNSGTTGGGAGGGGYYGGGGAGGYYATGGGGSGYINPLVNTSASFEGNTTNRYIASDDPSNPGTLDIASYSGSRDTAAPNNSGQPNRIELLNNSGFVKIRVNP